MNDFNSKIINIILDYIDNVIDIINYSLTCKDLYILSNEYIINYILNNNLLKMKLYEMVNLTKLEIPFKIRIPSDKCEICSNINNKLYHNDCSLCDEDIICNNCKKLCCINNAGWCDNCETYYCCICDNLEYSCLKCKKNLYYKKRIYTTKKNKKNKFSILKKIF